MVTRRPARTARPSAGLSPHEVAGATQEVPGTSRLGAPSDGHQQAWARELLRAQISDPTLVLPPPSPRQVRADLGDVLLIASHDAELQGALWATRPAAEAAYFAAHGMPGLAAWFTELHALAVDPAHRRLGVASRLLAALDVACRQQDQAAVFGVAANKPGLRQLYKDAGYRMLGVGQPLDLPGPDARQLVRFPLESRENRWVIKALS